MTTNRTQQFTRKKIQDYSYGLTDVIGKGYSSQVYKGKHDHTDQPVAIKVIDMKMLKNEINRHLLESEIQILKQIKHVPHVLKFHEVYTTKNNTYIVTELCSSDLTKKITEKLTQAEACHFMDQIIQGYLQIYQKQIVHRDLKPANILLTENDECKIADFGFAITNAQLSKPSKYNVGSPLYMAPESLKKNQYSYKTDIWSVGVIFYELLTTQTPWKSKNQSELLKKMENQRIQQIIQKKKLNFSPKIMDFLMKCLSVDVGKRLDPQELRKYTFSINRMPNNILTQAKMNNQLYPLRSAKQLTTILTTPSSSGKITQKYIFNNTLRTPSSKQISQNHSLNTTLKFNQTQQISSFHKNQRNQPKNDQTKQISKQLISEIHFCRFLFKLLQKIKESARKDGLLKQMAEEVSKVERKFTQFIKHKINNLTIFGRQNILGVEQTAYAEYKQCPDFKKIMKIAREYSERYQHELKQHWEGSFDKKFTTNETKSLIRKLMKRFEQDSGQIQANISEYQKEVIILDYLITAKQLIEMLVNGECYQKFARKSKIQDIVEGSTLTITYDLYEKILQRGKQFMII